MSGSDGYACSQAYRRSNQQLYISAIRGRAWVPTCGTSLYQFRRHSVLGFARQVPRMHDWRDRRDQSKPQRACQVQHNHDEYAIRFLIIPVVYFVLAVAVLMFASRSIPYQSSIPLPGGAIQMLRRPDSLYMETWIAGAPRIILTLPFLVVWRVLIGMGCLLMVVLAWLLWRRWRRETGRT